MLSDIKQVELDAAESKILIALFGSTEPSAKAQWLLNFLGIKINNIIQDFEYIIKPMLNDQGLVDGHLARGLLSGKYPTLCQMIPDKEFRLADAAEAIAKLVETLKGRLI